MSGLPATAIPLAVDLWLDGEWVEMSSADAEDILGPDYRMVDHALSTTHGRQDESSQVGPASVSVDLWNDDGWLTPENPESPWWSHWRRNTPLRVRLWDETLQVFEVVSISPQWPVGDVSEGGEPLLDEDGEEITDESGGTILDEVTDPGVSVLSVGAAGVLQRMGQRTKPLPSSLKRLALFTPNVSQMAAYFPFEDGSDSEVVASGLPGSTAVGSITGFTLASDSESLPGSSPLPKLSSGQSGSWSVQVPDASVVDNGFVVDVFMRYSKRPVAGAVSRFLDVLTAGGDLPHWAVDVDVDVDDIPTLKVRAWDAVGDLQVDASVVDPGGFFETMNQIRFRLDVGGAWSLRWRPLGGGVYVMSGSHPTVVLGAPRTIRSAFANPTGDVTVGHLSVQSTLLITGWAVPADQGWPGEFAAKRIVRLANESGIPVDVDGTYEESTRLGVQRPKPLMDLLQEAAEADGGILCEYRGSLALRYRTRRALYNQTPRITVSAHTDGLVNPFVPVLDDQQIANDVTVTRIDGASAQEVDQASIDGLYDQQFTLSLHTDLENTVRNHAAWRLHLGADAGLRTSEITIDFATATVPVSSGRARRWVGLNVGDIIRITDLPPQWPRWPGHIDLMVQGMRHEVTAFGWRMVLNCSPADEWTVGVWGESRYDAVDSTLADVVDETQTTVLVSTPGVQWTADPDDYPFDLLIGGVELVTATAATEDDPQEFTVIRNVNGYGRAHEAGSTVGLANPAILGL